MEKFKELLTSELNDVILYLDKYNIKTIENAPLRSNNGTGKKRVVLIRKIKENDLEIIWSYDNYNK